MELDGEGWVSLPSLLRPFGKRADNLGELLRPLDPATGEGWARVRVEPVWLTSRKGANGRGGNRADVTLLHHEDVFALVARLNTRGMPPEVLRKHDRYMREVAKALSDYFLRGRALDGRHVPGTGPP